MKKNMSGNTHTGNAHNSGNTYGASHTNYRPKSEMNDGNWFADHKKLLWGIGGAVVLGAGAFMLLKNKNGSDEYSDTYNEMNDLNQDLLNDNLGEEDMIITTITEFE
jgi:hypothetical protein